MDGWVVCKEHKEALEAAWEEDQEIQHMRELEVCENNTFGLWSERNVLFNDALRDIWSYIVSGGIWTQISNTGQQKWNFI